MIEKLDISEFIQLAKTTPVLDVRSPAEFDHAHFPGAISFPLFSDDERKIVGTTYKQNSRENAIKTGLDFFGTKMRKMVEWAEQLATNQSGAQHSRMFLVHCWRGGMRSAAVAWLLDLYGFKIYTLTGGYKSFRNWVIHQMTLKYNFKILGGYTGSGKTLVIKELSKNDIPVIDLEKLANHKGSAFGALGEEKQPTQEMFENKLSHELYFQSLYEKPIWLEDESQRVGSMLIPKSVWEQMRNSPIQFLKISFEERLKNLVHTYGKHDRVELVNATMRIQKRLGGLETKNAIHYLLENDIENCFRILLNYYDKLYTKGLNNREQLNELLTAIECDTVSADNYKKLFI